MLAIVLVSAFFYKGIRNHQPIRVESYDHNQKCIFNSTETEFMTRLDREIGDGICIVTLDDDLFLLFSQIDWLKCIKHYDDFEEFNHLEWMIMGAHRLRQLTDLSYDELKYLQHLSRKMLTTYGVDYLVDKLLAPLMPRS